MLEISHHLLEQRDNNSSSSNNNNSNNDLDLCGNIDCNLNRSIRSSSVANQRAKTRLHNNTKTPTTTTTTTTTINHSNTTIKATAASSAIALAPLANSTIQHKQTSSHHRVMISNRRRQQQQQQSRSRSVSHYIINNKSQAMFSITNPFMMHQASIKMILSVGLLLMIANSFQTIEAFGNEHTEGNSAQAASIVGGTDIDKSLVSSPNQAESFSSDDLMAAESQADPAEHKSAFTVRANDMSALMSQGGPQMFQAHHSQQQQVPQQQQQQQPQSSQQNPMFNVMHQQQQVQPKMMEHHGINMAAAAARMQNVAHKLPGQQQQQQQQQQMAQFGQPNGQQQQHHMHGPHSQLPPGFMAPNAAVAAAIAAGAPNGYGPPAQAQMNNQQQQPQQMQMQMQPQPPQQLMQQQQQQQPSPLPLPPQPQHRQQHPAEVMINAAAAAAAAAAANQQQPTNDQQQQQQQQQMSRQQNSLYANLDSNSIEADLAHSANSALAVASSAQHPVIAASPPGIGSSALSSSSGSQSQENWPLPTPDIPKIVNLEVKCEKNLMKVSIEFDKIFNGIIFSKGHYNTAQCSHVSPQSGKQSAYFDISINSCGTQGNTQNGLYGMGGQTGSGTYFENTIVIQYDQHVQEVWDQARKLRCTWHDQYEKAVTFRPFPVDMLDIVRADFAGDNVGCWMQIQVGKGPWASEVAGIVKIGQTMTMVLAIKDEENKFDMLVRNCFAHDAKKGPIELVDKSGCITRPKLMSKFTKIKNFGSSATVLSYAHFQAFKFPDSMEVHFQCTIQICRHQCPEQCSLGGTSEGNSFAESTLAGTFNIHSNSQAQPGSHQEHMRKASLSRERRDVNWLINGTQHHARRLFGSRSASLPATQMVGLNKVIQVVSSGDLAFSIQQQQQQQMNNLNESTQMSLDGQQLSASQMDLSNTVCMSSFNFVISLIVLVLTLLISCLVALSLYMRQRNYAKCSKLSSKSPHPTSSTSTTNKQVQQQMLNSLQQQQQQVPTAYTMPVYDINSVRNTTRP